MWLILVCATVHDTFLNNLKPASKDSGFIPVDEWVPSSLYIDRLSGPNEGCRPCWVNIMRVAVAAMNKICIQEILGSNL